MSFLWPSYDDRLAELLERARGGDQAAFRSLYGELYAPVARYMARRVATAEDAEDLVAKVFHRLLERLDDFDAKRGTVPMFVLAMARSAVIDHLRAARAVLPMDDVEGVLADEAGTPLDALVREEELREVRALLLELSPSDREMFALRYGEGLRHGQIAEIMGIGVAAVKQRFSRALRDLKARLSSKPQAKASGGEGKGGDQKACDPATGAASEGAVVDVRV